MTTKRLTKIIKSAEEMLDKGFCIYCGRMTQMISVPKSGTFVGIAYMICKNPRCGADIKAFINEFPKVMRITKKQKELPA